MNVFGGRHNKRKFSIFRLELQQAGILIKTTNTTTPSCSHLICGRAALQNRSYTIKSWLLHVYGDSLSAQPFLHNTQMCLNCTCMLMRRSGREKMGCVFSEFKKRSYLIRFFAKLNALCACVLVFSLFP